MCIYKIIMYTSRKMLARIYIKYSIEMIGWKLTKLNI
jgi:hypothetical protein